PVMAAFLLEVSLVDEALAEAAVASSRRLADAAEMAQHPHCQLSTNNLVLPTIGWNEYAHAELALENTGEVEAAFTFTTLDTETPMAPPWMQLEPVLGAVEPGGKVRIGVSAYVGCGNSGTAGSVMSASAAGEMQAILVLRIIGGGDFFIAVSGQYNGSCFGIGLTQLTSMDYPATVTCRHPAQPGAAQPNGGGSRSQGVGSAAATASDEPKPLIDLDSEPDTPEAPPPLIGVGVEPSQSSAASLSNLQMLVEGVDPGDSSTRRPSCKTSAAFGVCVPKEYLHLITFLARHVSATSSLMWSRCAEQVESEDTDPSVAGEGSLEDAQGSELREPQAASSSEPPSEPSGAVSTFFPDPLADCGRDEAFRGGEDGASPRGAGGAVESIAEVRRLLDKGGTAADLQAACVTPAAAIKTLLALFRNLPDPLMPTPIAQVCELCVPSDHSAMELLYNQLGAVEYATFTAVISLLRAMLSNTDESILAPASVASALAKQWFDSEGSVSAFERRASFVQLFFNPSLDLPVRRSTAESPGDDSWDVDPGTFLQNCMHTVDQLNPFACA
ncbi:hypothetical protein CYMTET_26826, partial [Cymbomonas tetramitiformis]